jgi:hypothetical protein
LDQPYWLKLDSGDSSITLDRNLVQFLGLREVAKRAFSKGGRVDASFAVVPRIDIGPVYAKNLVVSVMRFGTVEEGVHVVGLLGCDFIAGRPLAIDFRNQSVTAMDLKTLAMDRHWTSVRTPLATCRPSIRVRLEKQPATLVLDLGARDTLLNEDVVDRIGDAARRVDAKRVSYIGGDVLSAAEYVVPNASAGGLDLGPLVATVVPGGRGQDLTNDGTLGLNMLKNYRLVLDYAHQRTYFQRYPADDDAR